MSIVLTYLYPFNSFDFHAKINHFILILLKNSYYLILYLLVHIFYRYHSI